MIRAYTAAAVRAAEQPLLAAGQGLDLMHRASHGLSAGVITTLRARGRRLYGAKIMLLVGSGNNGGDALFAGALLCARGASATAFLASPRTHPQALAAFAKAGGRYLALEGGTSAVEPSAAEHSAAERVARAAAMASQSDVVVDGLLGTGARGGLRGPAADLMTALQRLSGSQRPAVVACDVPSGVDPTTGEVQGPVLHADRTVTFGAYKSGLLLAPGELLCGEVELVDIGIGQWLGNPEVQRLQAGDIARLLPRPLAQAHKYTRGVAGIIAGSASYPGAALLATAAASACGPGMVRYLGPDKVAAALHLRNPEVVCSAAAPGEVRVQAWLAGPGIDDDEPQLDRARAALRSAVPTVVDAAALPLVEAAAENSHLILTPHAGELARLLGRWGHPLDRDTIAAAPLEAARLAAQLAGAVVLLKGPTTIVAEPGGTVFTQANGNPRLATAGSGDTLAGILVALLAMSAGEGPPSSAELAATAALAAAVHGELSQDHPEQPLNAGLLAARIPQVWGRLASGRSRD